MNYNKKRKRQNGRQDRNCGPKYNIWIDEFAQVNLEIDRLIEEGVLPRLDFNPVPVVKFP